MLGSPREGIGIPPRSELRNGSGATILSPLRSYVGAGVGTRTRMLTPLMRRATETLRSTPRKRPPPPILVRPRLVRPISEIKRGSTPPFHEWSPRLRKTIIPLRSAVRLTIQTLATRATTMPRLPSILVTPMDTTIQQRATTSEITFPIKLPPI